MISRRQFNKGLVALALSGLSRQLLAGPNKLSMQLDTHKGYGPLKVDPKGMLDLPDGFSYRIISSFGQMMDDGLTVPDRADGMGCIGLDSQRVVLIRNHEIKIPKQRQKNPSSEQIKLKAYDVDQYNDALPGGTSNILYNVATQEVEREYMSLIGTIRNCAGGVTPWGSWLTCEESVATPSDSIGIKKEHGYVFEVPATANGLVAAKPIKAMGRFNHEAACVDPRTGIVYLTEDRGDSLFYRYIPNEVGNLHAGGILQALCITAQPQFDTRNWETSTISMHQRYQTHWVGLQEVESPKDDLRVQGYNNGAALFARGEGIHWAENELYFCCTNGGKAKCGQVMRYTPSKYEGTNRESQSPATLELVVESPDVATFNYGDNITVAPTGHLIVCEDQYTDQVHNELKGITPSGEIYSFAQLRWQTEPAGACFSPDGTTMFLNIYSPSVTVAITGPWDKFTA